jgi:hypothetical protein
MIELKTTTEEDLDKIRAWIQADPFHRDDPKNQAEALLTGKGLLTFRVVDDIGDVMFIRLDAEGDMIRWSAQFGPEKEVSKYRVIKALLKAAIPAVLSLGKIKAYKGIVYESVNPELIDFMKIQKFDHLSGDDYALIFEGTCAV